jgi:hypothetical protein
MKCEHISIFWSIRKSHPEKKKKKKPFQNTVAILNAIGDSYHWIKKDNNKLTIK